MPKLPEKIEDWKAPWETETGETEIDKDKLKRYLFGLLGDKERLQGSNATLTTERDELKGKLEAKDREGETETDKLKREKKELEEKLANVKPTDPLELVRLTVALEKGVPAGHVKRLVGSTKEELEADADELMKSFGTTGNTDNKDDGEEEVLPRRTPRGSINPGDPAPDAGKELSTEKALEIIPRVR
jgi:hypothetical protein